MSALIILPSVWRTGDLVLHILLWCIFHPVHRRKRLNLVFPIRIFHTTVAKLDEPLQVGVNHAHVIIVLILFVVVVVVVVVVVILFYYFLGGNHSCVRSFGL